MQFLVHYFGSSLFFYFGMSQLATDDWTPQTFTNVACH